jgi:tape measure domain-containing protein
MAKTSIDTKAAVQEINNLIRSFNAIIEATGNVSTVSKANFRKVENALQALRTVSNQASLTMNAMAVAQAKSATQATAAATAINKSTSATKQNTTATTANTAATNTNAAATNKAANANKNLGSSLKGVVTGFGELMGAFGIGSAVTIFVALSKSAFDLSRKFDSIRLSLSTIAGDMHEIAISEVFLKDITNSFGVELASTSERWTRFLAAAKQSGVTLKDTQDIFRSLTKASSVLGLQTDDLSTVYLALEQMMSKGKVTTEELRRQLGEKLPGAVGIMAKAVGVNVEQLDKMLKKGEVLSADALPKFAKALEKAYGIETIEKVSSLSAEVNRLTNAWQTFTKSFTESESDIIKTIGLIAKGISYSIQGLIAFMTPDDMLEKNKYMETVAANAKKLREMNYKGDVDATKARFENDKKAYEEYAKFVKDKSTKGGLIGKLSNAVLNLVDPSGSDDANLAKLRGRMAAADAAYQEARLNAEKGKPAKFDEDKKDGRKPATFYIKEVNDLTNEKIKAELEARKKLNEVILNEDKNSFRNQTLAMKDNFSVEKELADVMYEEEIERAQKHYDKQLQEFLRAKARGDKMVGDQGKFLADIKKERDDAEILANSNKNKKLTEAEYKFGETQEMLAKRRLDSQLATTEEVYDNLISAAKEEYEASAKTEKDKEKLEKELTRIAVEQGNARIRILIANYEAQLSVGDLTEKETKYILEQIAKLRAGLANIVPEESIDEAKEKLAELLEFIGEAFSEFQNFGDALFERKIENINAEIEAERDKYDTLIAMAKGNKEEQEKLQLERDLKIKELEKKRLQEQRKQAIFDKANALIQIAINTAVALTRLPRDGGFLGLAAVPAMIALGAVQAATVIAQPLPKYKEGLKNADRDHIGVINDGGQKEFIERDGKILSTDTKNAIVALKKGDTIHKSYEDMVANSMAYNAAALSSSVRNLGNESISKSLENVFDKNLKDLKSDLKNGIREGFKNVTINNHTTYDSSWIAYKNNTL